MKRIPSSSPVRALYKGPAIAFFLLVYAALGLLLSCVPLSMPLRRSARVRTSSFFARIAIRVFGIRVREKHRGPLRERRGRLVVANHVSYVDILVLSSIAPLVFITSVEMRHTPLLGQLALWGGSLFVERRRPSGLKQEIEDISRVLNQGFSVVLFPEGTTSNGERVHPFKRSLFDAAVSARADVLPMCLRYRAINGEPVTHANRDLLYYYGGMRFSRHFPRFLGLRSVEVEIQALRTIKVHDDIDRKALAAEAQALIGGAYGV